MTAPRPVLNITHKAPGQPARKFARVTFPEGHTRAQIAAMLAHFPEEAGFRVDLRQVGPMGFSLPLDLADIPQNH